MKIAIPWILAVLLAAGMYFVYSGVKQKDAELVQLRQQVQELPALKAANEDLKKIPALNAEVERLHKETEDLLRLRSEVGQLQATNKLLTTELQRAKAQGGAAAQQVQKQMDQLAAENAALKTQEAQVAATQTPQLQAQAKALAAACINNLRLIESAKQAWGLEYRRLPGAMPTPTDLAPYLPGRVLPACPAGGVYSVNALNMLPTCSIPGHALQ